MPNIEVIKGITKPTKNQNMASLSSTFHDLHESNQLKKALHGPHPLFYHQAISRKIMEVLSTVIMWVAGTTIVLLTLTSLSCWHPSLIMIKWRLRPNIQAMLLF